MKKLSFCLVAFLAIALAVGSSFSSKDAREIITRYWVFGFITYVPCPEPVDWPKCISELPNQVAAEENPITSEPAPFETEQSLTDFVSVCEPDPSRLCLVLVKEQDGVFVEILAIVCGEFTGF